MKKQSIHRIIILLLLLVCVLGMSACESNGFTVTYAASGGGKIVGETQQTVEAGKDATAVRAEASDGYVFIEWSDGSKEPSRQDVAVTADKTVTAIFGSMIRYTAEKGGSIVGELSQTVPYGQSGSEVTAMPQEGYTFRVWSDGVTTPTRKDTDVTAGLDVTAYFAKLVMKVKYIAGEGGRIEGYAEQTVKYGEYADPIVASPIDNSYKFDRWSDGGTTRGRYDLPYDDMVLTAYFVKREKATLHYVAGAGGTIEGAAKQDTYEEIYGTFVTAIPDTGYAFESWSDGKTDAKRHDMGKGDQTFTAEFRKIFDGLGTKESPYLVNDYDGLMDMVYYPFAYYKLTQDIDLSGISYLPAFDYMVGFYGDFDGGNFTIQNMTVDEDTLYPSLFGYMGAGKIHDLNMTGVSIRVPNEDMPKSLGVGAVASVAFGELENIRVSGTIRGESLALMNKPFYIGGLVGLTFSKVTNCTSDMNITLTNVLTKAHNQLNVGGLIGMMGDDVTGCSSSGTITFTSDKTKDYSKNIGGLIGVYSDSGYLLELTVSACSSSVEINGNGSALIGGLIGNIYGAQVAVKILDCHASGDITLANSGSACGFLGDFRSSKADAEIRNCYATGNVTVIKGYCASGFMRDLYNDTNEMKIIDCYSIGKVSGGSISVGFALLITGRIENCYTTSDIQGSKAYGFAEHIEGSIKRCYTSGDIISTSLGMGFAQNLFGAEMTECFSTGEVNAKNLGCGLIMTVRNSKIVNCYSLSNITMSNTVSSSLVVGGLVFNNDITSTINNCYYAGKISVVTDNSNKVIGALVTSNKGNIKNCHWILYNDSFAQSAFGSNYNETVDVCSYDSIEDIYMIADLLNDGQGDIWVNIPNRSPQLKYFSEN